jgi:DNA-binding NtrC family response regulator
MVQANQNLIGVGSVVLLVDDSVDLLQTYGAGLRYFGYEVITAESCEQALERLRTDKKIDLLVSDVIMPDGETGIYLARETARLRPATPILLITGHAFGLLEQLGARKNEFEVLEKPLSVRHLATRIAEMIGRRSVSASA